MQAAMAARDLDRNVLLDQNRTRTGDDEDKVFLITTFHPNDHTLRNLVKNNWEILGQSDQTFNLYNKRLTVGYRRPKNLSDMLVHANIPRLEGDDLIDPTYVAPPVQATLPNPITLETNTVIRQPPITEFFYQGAAVSAGTTTSQLVANITGTSKHLGTNPAKQGFAFCKHNICRFCPKINKSGKITSHTTG